MRELIKITEENGKRLVSARELYFGLGMDTKKWSRWRETNIEKSEYFTENNDWTAFPIMVNGNETVDYAITLDFAKHLAMMSKAKKSHEYRNYFIECEKQLQQVKLDSYMIEDRIERARRWIEEQEERAKLEEENKKLIEENIINKPKADYFDGLVDKNLLTNFRDTAKELKIKQNEFIDWLIENNYIYRDKKNKLRPKANHTPSLFEIKEWSFGNKVGIQTLITPRGRETFRLLLGNK